MFDDVTDKISGAYDENLTSKQLCKVLLQFDEMFEEMTDLERKEFLYTLIERIDLFPERQENGSILKRIRFKFRVDYDAEAGGKVLINENGVETVVLLSKGMVDNRKVKVDFSLEDMDLSEFKGKATYEQIKVYVLEQTGLKVSNLYIAQIKKKCGLDVGENFNLPKSENAKQPKCTPEKEEAIMQAFKHFGII